MTGLLIVLSLYLVLTLGKSGEEQDDCKVLERIKTEDGTIEIVEETCKEGLPHTTNSDTIRMTKKNYESDGIKSLLVHERVHLDQKRNPEKWTKFYKQNWDYDITAKSPLPEHLTKLVRPNPDTAAAPFAIWRERYVFFPKMKEDMKLKTAEVQVWDLSENKEVDIPEQWKARFCDTSVGCPHQYEHPHELSAEFITLRPRSKAASQLFEWYNGDQKSLSL